MALSEQERIRRTAILCGHCLRNIASYRAGWRGRRFRVPRNFWQGANGAFIDVAILDWCKLFADERNGQHHWSRSVSDPISFKTNLLRRLELTQAQFDEYIETFKIARDKFIAHLDDLHVMNVPLMRAARASTAFLLDQLLTDPGTGQWFRPEEESPAFVVYQHCYKQAFMEYGKANI